MYNPVNPVLLYKIGIERGQNDIGINIKKNNEHTKSRK